MYNILTIFIYIKVSLVELLDKVLLSGTIS